MSDPGVYNLCVWLRLCLNASYMVYQASHIFMPAAAWLFAWKMRHDKGKKERKKAKKLYLKNGYRLSESEGQKKGTTVESCEALMVKQFQIWFK